MGKYIRTLTVQFDGDILYKGIPLFRGAVLKSIGENTDLFYHNHIRENAFRYSATPLSAIEQNDEFVKWLDLFY